MTILLVNAFLTHPKDQACLPGFHQMSWLLRYLYLGAVLTQQMWEGHVSLTMLTETLPFMDSVLIMSQCHTLSTQVAVVKLHTRTLCPW